jgi:sRNA-binding carbon storage regulator CsrA
LDERIGLEGPKEQIAVWRTEIQIDQQGEETSATSSLSSSRDTRIWR